VPSFRKESVLDIAWGIKAFLNLHVGVTRSDVPKVRHVDGRSQSGGIEAGNVVWIFGFGRSGSTWLSSMMGEMKGHTVWQEPTVGALFGNFYYGDPWIGAAHHNNPSFIMGSRRDIWVGLVRSFFLNSARAMFPAVGPTETLVVKEPYGSIGAPLLMEALPESRMIFLVRDPRDVVASSMDAFAPSGWGSHFLSANHVPDLDSEAWARLYSRSMGNARQAYENHQQRKALVRYEDLRVDTLSAMQRLYSALEIEVKDEALAEAVAKHSWEAIPEDQKGKGKFYRRADPGGWKQDLTAEEVQTVETITAPIPTEFYS